MITTAQLLTIAPHVGSKAATFSDAISAAADRFEINSPARLAAFVAQMAEETGEFTVLVENLNYSAAQLLKEWPNRFDAASAAAFAHQPEKIANHVYGSRGGNRGEASGDGWRYRGRGGIQTTFLPNYEAVEKALGLPVVAQPELLEQPGPAMLSAAFYWQQRGCNALADAGKFIAITRLVNGGLGNLKTRMAYWARAKLALGVPA